MKRKLSIIIPIYNEKEFIVQLLTSIIEQYDYWGNKIPYNVYQLILVNNNSTDNSMKVVKEFLQSYKELTYYIINEDKQGIIPTRIKGFDFIRNKNISTEYVSSVDADVILHRNWICKTLEIFETKCCDSISYDGDYGCEFWSNVPELMKKYLNAVGTIYFDERTIKKFKLNKSHYAFTNKIFYDFIRPLSSACCSFRTESYFRAGGFFQEYDNNGNELLAESWRLMFAMDRLNMKQVYISEVPFITSPRRIIGNPKVYFGLNDNISERQNYRLIDNNNYALINKLATEISNFEEYQKEYIVKYYIIARCITNSNLIQKNKNYFEGFLDAFKKYIDIFNSSLINNSVEIFDFSNELFIKYGKKIINNIENGVASNE